jgi:hypothetical protein
MARKMKHQRKTSFAPCQAIGIRMNEPADYTEEIRHRQEPIGNLRLGDVDSLVAFAGTLHAVHQITK